MTPNILGPVEPLHWGNDLPSSDLTTRTVGPGGLPGRSGPSLWSRAVIRTIGTPRAPPWSSRELEGAVPLFQASAEPPLSHLLPKQTENQAG